jgi:hypothetical protein
MDVCAHLTLPPTRTPTRPGCLQPVRFEADQVEVEAAEFEITQFIAERIRVPARPRRQFIRRANLYG